MATRCNQIHTLFNQCVFRLRKVQDDTVKDIMDRGEDLYNAMYGTTADGVQSLLDAIHPDMGKHSQLTLISASLI